MPKAGSSGKKKAVRARMAETGESYVTALRAIEAERAARGVGEPDIAQPDETSDE